MVLKRHHAAVGEVRLRRPPKKLKTTPLQSGPQDPAAHVYGWLPLPDRFRAGRKPGLL